jgi:hypothetical protein
MAERRGATFLLTGLLLGIAAGLLFAWVISPVKYVDTEPRSLRADFKDQYRALIAAAYSANGDLGRASARLALLQDPDPAAALSSQASRAGQPESEARALAALSAALSQPASLPGSGQQTAVAETVAAVMAAQSPALQAAEATNLAMLTQAATGPSETGQSATPAPLASPTPTRGRSTPPATPTRPPALPTPRPSPTPGAPFQLIDSQQVCGQNPQPLLQVQVNDAAGEPVAGVEFVVTWEGNHRDHFFTGFKPAVNPGYADFTMTPGVVYSLRLAAGGQPVNDLYAPGCPGGTAGGLLLTFAQK